MNEQNLDRTIKTLWSLIVDKKDSSSLPEELARVEGFEALYNAILEIRDAVTFISEGKMDYQVKGNGYLLDIVKTLQIKMKQITDLEIEAIESKEHFEKIFDTSPETTAITRLKDGLMLDVNEAFSEVFGYKKEEVIGKYAQEINLYENYLDRQRLINEIKSNGECKNLKLNFRKKSGEQIIALVSAKVIKHKNILNLIVVARDITFECQLQEALNKSEEKYKILFENVLEMITVFQNGRLKICNQISEELTGYSREELIEGFAIDFIHPDDRERMINEHSRILKGKAFDNNSSTFRIKRKDNSIRWIEMKSIKIEWDNADATLNLLFDITECKLAVEETEFLSYHDQLTGLYNRRFYEKEIKILNDDERYNPISIIMADLNGLKLTNDAFGHAAGDTLLTSIAAILKRKCRKNDIIARIGGDEFAILLPNTDAERAKIIINSINKAVENEEIENAVLSLSMGLAVKTSAFEDINEMFKIAEDDMYSNKLSKSEDMKRRTIERVIDKLYESDEEVQHSKNVGRISEAIASELKLSRGEIEKIRMAGLMHDIGKIGVGRSLFNKSGELSNEESIAVKRHSEVGYRILNSVDEFGDVSRFILEHHEKWNGSGYPKGLKEDEISLPARIIAVADSYDKMICGGPNRKAINTKEAEEELIKNSGVKFDPFVVKIFIDKVLKKIQNNYIE